MDEGRKIPPSRGITFESAADMVRLLTPARLNLFEAVRKRTVPIQDLAVAWAVTLARFAAMWSHSRSSESSLPARSPTLVTGVYVSSRPPQASPSRLSYRPCKPVRRASQECAPLSTSASEIRSELPPATPRTTLAQLTTLTPLTPPSAHNRRNTHANSTIIAHHPNTAI